MNAWPDERLTHPAARTLLAIATQKMSGGVTAVTNIHASPRPGTAMKNEVLAKMVCHDIVCVIHELYEVGPQPKFWGQTVPVGA